MINPNRKVSKLGVHFVKGIVQRMDCSFQEFDQENDQGNDCYIEFVKDLTPCNYGIFAQIKSGQSFKDKKGYKIPADNDHLKYWSKNLYKSIGIVYDPEISKAFWVDISEYIQQNSHILSQKHHNIRVSIENEFSDSTFNNFMGYCFRYKEALQDYGQLGRSLELFSDTENSNSCFEGFKALHSSHRDKKVSWFYIISNFARIKEEAIRRHILGIISNYFNPDIFWHKGNITNYPREEETTTITRLLSNCFGIREVELIVPYMHDGITRGSFSYLVYLVLCNVKDADLVLKKICFNLDIDSEERNFCFWLYMHLSKYKSLEKTLANAEEYFQTFPDAEFDEALVGVYESIKNGDLYPVG